MNERFGRDRGPIEPRGKPDFLRSERTSSPNKANNGNEWDSDAWYKQMKEAGMVRPSASEMLLSRRKFLVGAGAVVGAAAIDMYGKYSPLAKFLDDKFVGQYNYDEAVKEAKGFLKERYGIDLVMGNEKDQDNFRGDPVALERYRVSLRVIVQEMSKYPPEMIHKIAEGRGFEIRVVDKLLVKEGQQQATKREFRAGGLAPFLRQGKAAQFIIDASYEEFHQRAMVHHELNHRGSQKWENQAERDQKWMGFHNKVSANPYRKKREGANDYERPPEHFFIIEYAATAPVEDEAVCAELMMNPLWHMEFIDRWRNEQDQNAKDVLAAKYVETKNNYAKWSDGKIDQTFWDSIIREGERLRAQNRTNG